MICGSEATTAGVESEQTYWRMRNVKYAVVDMTHSDFGWSRRILGLCSSIKAKAGEFQREFPHEKFGHAMLEMIKSDELIPMS